MKNIMLRFVYLLFIMVVSFSCENEENLQPEGQWTLSEPTIVSPTADGTIILDETAPSETITFSWEAAKSSANYLVTYEVVLDTLGTTDFSTPILALASSNRGEDTSLSVDYQTIDQLLSYSGYKANEEATLTWSVRATSLSKSSTSVGEFSLVRFETETIPTRLFISGTATENNNNLSEAISLKRLTNLNGVQSNIHEVYTSLTAGNSYKFYNERTLPALQYGGSDGDLNLFTEGITAETTGQYRIRVNLDTNTYNLLTIDYWSMVGTPINNGWDGDEPLEYQGGGVWKASIQLIETGGFAFRANGDWGYLLKRIEGTPNSVVLENDAPNQSFSVEDIPSELTGRYYVTLDLSAENYTFSFEEDNTVIEPIETPAQLFLFENGIQIEEFIKSADIFESGRYIPMQANANYSLNSASDGSGIAYSLNGTLANTVTPDGDRVSDSLSLIESNAVFMVNNNRALNLSIDFSIPQITWVYYNYKLFHWQIWEERQEFLMEYSHPNTYTITADLTAGYDSKFISPFDFDLGSDNPASLTGNLINGEGGSNILSIATDGSYKATIVLQDDYQSGTYEFIQQ